MNTKGIVMTVNAFCIQVVQISVVLGALAGSLMATNEQDNQLWRTQNLTHKELQWLQKHPTITYSEINWKPLSIIENNQMTGIMGEYLKIIAQKTGLSFEFIPSKSWPHVLEQFANKKIDIVPGVGNTPEERSLGLFTQSYASYPMTLVGKGSISYIDDIALVADKKFSVPQYYTSHKVLQRILPNANIITTKNIHESLINVASDKADIFVGHLATSIYYISEILQQEDLRIIGNLDFMFEHHYLVQNDQPILKNIINKVFDTITEKDRLRIYSEWVHVSIEQNASDIILWEIVVLGLLILAAMTYVINRLRRLLKKIHRQQQEVEASIEYALLIQQAFMTSEDTFTKYFKDHYVLWQPKDIVSGDIYLSHEVNDNEILFIFVDCIGHSVSGAFITMYINTLKEQLLAHINGKEVIQTNQILSQFHKQIRQMVQANHKLHIGFDGIIMHYNKKTNKIKYASANIPLYYSKRGELTMQTADRISIGLSQKQNLIFTEHELDITEEMTLYFVTDGIYDQIGAKQEFPFGKSGFKKLITKYQHKNLAGQVNSIYSDIEKYQGNAERVDDMTFIALKIEPLEEKEKDIE